jgi:hypothetical protein
LRQLNHLVLGYSRLPAYDLSGQAMNLIISVPKIKTHEKVGVTCELKGCGGAIDLKQCPAPALDSIYIGPLSWRTWFGRLTWA